MRSAFAGDVTSVGSPLAIASILGIQYAHRAAPIPNPMTRAHPGVMHDDAIRGRVDSAFTAR